MKQDKIRICDECKVEVKVYDVSDESEKYKLLISCPNCHLVYGLIRK